MNILEAASLTKKYGDFTAVNNLDFNVVEGEIFDFSSTGPVRPLPLIC